MINENAVVVFSKTWCPFCKETKNLLDKGGVKYLRVELDTVDQGNAFHKYLKKKSK